MKHLITGVLSVILMLTNVQGKSLKPYILGAEGNLTVTQTGQILSENLIRQNFMILGKYNPADDSDRLVLVISDQGLLNAISNTGDLTGFGAALRVAVTREHNQSLVTYVNPIYQGNAYFKNDFAQVEPVFTDIFNRLRSSMKGIGKIVDTPFGSEDGLTAKELRKYHYMFGMEYFDDIVTLNTFKTYEDAVLKIESNLKDGIPNVREVYSIDIPGNNLKLYGLALSGPTGESHFLPIIDITEPHHTAFLPYEILVNGNKVVMLHGRYRIALSFPDLTMMTFGKIMSTPGDIEDLMKSVTE